MDGGIRARTHLDVTADMIEAMVSRVREVAASAGFTFRSLGSPPHGETLGQLRQGQQSWRPMPSP